MNYRKLISVLQKIAMSAITVLTVSYCSDEELMLVQEPGVSSELTAATMSTASLVSPSDCAACTYIVPSNTYLIDGAALKLAPGSVICLKAGNIYKSLVFRNIVGTAENPITITNCGGTATIDATGKSFALVTEYSKYFRVSGGSTAGVYGIKIIGSQNAVKLDKLSTNFEIDHLDIYNAGFAGIMAKTDPTCDVATTRGYFTMRNVSIHDNYIHVTGGEGMYIGHSFYEKGVSLSCGVKLPHLIEGLKIFNNKVMNTGWDGIQVGCALTGAEVFSNRIENYGTKNTQYQNNGLQFSEGTKGIAYSNYIKSGPGIGINVIGYGDAFMHDNIIVNAGTHGIFCDDRTSPGAGIKILNNTIVNPKKDGIRLYTDLVTNIVSNNIVVNPGSYSTYTYPRTGNDAYLYLLNKTMNIQSSNNIFTRDINYLKFANAAGYNYRLTSVSPALNKGKDITIYSISKDFYDQARLKGTAYDVGASEY